VGEYYEHHLRDHAKDLEEALENYLHRAQRDELVGLFAGAKYALDVLTGTGAAALTSSARRSGRGRSVYTPSLSYHLSTPEEMCSPEPAVVNSPVQRLVEDKSECVSPDRERRCHVTGLCQAIKHRIGAWRRYRWLPRGKKEAREKEKAGNKSSSGSRKEEGKRK
jgi:hypothetical protein